eukprot:GHVS01007937.1.p1 GENE.GHVS01007937.1~~GHVS01007937.1.p1  ORF type:complete len:503 (+),score=84.42 GHVS01007937.1:86-1594(+)
MHIIRSKTKTGITAAGITTIRWINNINRQQDFCSSTSHFIDTAAVCPQATSPQHSTTATATPSGGGGSDGSVVGSTSGLFVQELLKERIPDAVYLGLTAMDIAHNNVLLQTASTHTILRQLMICKEAAESLDSLVATQLETLNNDLFASVGCIFSEVAEVSEYLFECKSKRFRPTLNILVNQIVDEKQKKENKIQIGKRGKDEKKFYQQKMIEVAEMIHTASMLHDDVLDEAEVRRGRLAAHKRFSTKKAILGGDFLLARACRISASLGCPEAFSRTASIVESLIKGELIQSRQTPTTNSLESMFHLYLTKTYHKTAALMAESCSCGALLGGCSPHLQQLAHELGCAVGMAFQLYDDLLDWTATSADLGKPTMNDLRSGVITAPVYLSLSATPKAELLHIISKKQKTEQDVQKVLEHVQQNSAIQRTEFLVMLYAARALQLLSATSGEPLGSTHDFIASLTQQQEHKSNDVSANTKCSLSMASAPQAALAALLLQTLTRSTD